MTAGEIVVGVVVRPWGTKGQFLLDPLGNEPDFVLGPGVLRLRSREGSISERALAGSHFAGGRLVVRIEGCGTVEQAEALRGAEILRDTAGFEAPEPGAFYPHQLVGLTVVRASGDPVGVVERVVETAGPDLLAVRADGREILVPFAAAICRVDLERGKVTIDPPEGLLELS